MTRLALSALVLTSLLAAPVRAQAPASEAPTAPASASERKLYLQASLGYLLPVPRHHRHDQGADLAVAAGVPLGKWRLGGELRYTFWGGFDSDRPTYRIDLGFVPAYELFATRYVSMQLGGSFLFSRAGTYRRSGVSVPGACGPDGCDSEPGEPHDVSFVAWYGFSAAFDITLFFPYCFVRASGMHTSWYWTHERDAPRMEHWAHFALGYAY